MKQIKQIINIGLDKSTSITKGNFESNEDRYAAVKTLFSGIDASVRLYPKALNGYEDVAIIEVYENPWNNDEIFEISKHLDQDCISVAHLYKLEYDLIGPRADKYGNSFAYEYFNGF